MAERVRKMSTVSFSTFYLQIQRQFNDYTANTLDLIKMSIQDRAQEIETYYAWPELLKIHEFTTVANDRMVDLSAFATYRTDGIRYIADPAVPQKLRPMTLGRYIDITPDYTELTGETAWFAPVTDTRLYLGYTPTTAKIMTMYIQARHKAMTATSQNFDFNDDRMQILRYGVVADMYVEKDDDRYAAWEGKYMRALRRNRGDMLRNANSNPRLLPGSSIE